MLSGDRESSYVPSAISEHIVWLCSADSSGRTSRWCLPLFALRTGSAQQAANFIRTVPVAADELPSAIDLELAGNCAGRPHQQLNAELHTFLTSVEAHYERKAALYVAPEFERIYPVKRRVGRQLWDPRFLRRPTHQDWVIWQATALRTAHPRARFFCRNSDRLSLADPVRSRWRGVVRRGGRATGPPTRRPHGERSGQGGTGLNSRGNLAEDQRARLKVFRSRTTGEKGPAVRGPQCSRSVPPGIVSRGAAGARRRSGSGGTGGLATGLGGDGTN